LGSATKAFKEIVIKH